MPEEVCVQGRGQGGCTQERGVEGDTRRALYTRIVRGVSGRFVCPVSGLKCRAVQGESGEGGARGRSAGTYGSCLGLGMGSGPIAGAALGRQKGCTHMPYLDVGQATAISDGLGGLEALAPEPVGVRWPACMAPASCMGEECVQGVGQGPQCCTAAEGADAVSVASYRHGGREGGGGACRAAGVGGILVLMMGMRAVLR